MAVPNVCFRPNADITFVRHSALNDFVKQAFPVTENASPGASNEVVPAGAAKRANDSAKTVDYQSACVKVSTVCSGRTGIVTRNYIVKPLCFSVGADAARASTTDFA